MRTSRIALAFAAALFASLTASAQQAPKRYVDPELGYSIVVPLDEFDELGNADGKLQLESRDGLAQLSIYGEPNVDRLSAAEIAAGLEASDAIGEVTYRAGGANWRVLSGFYRGDAGRDDDLVFYLKLMMSPDRSRYAVFAISYPRSDKPRFDPVVERLEDTFRPPA